MNVLPHSPATINRACTFNEGLNTIHLCIRNAQEEQTPVRFIGTAEATGSCLGAVGSDQLLVAGGKGSNGQSTVWSGHPVNGPNAGIRKLITSH